MFRRKIAGVFPYRVAGEGRGIGILPLRFATGQNDKDVCVILRRPVFRRRIPGPLAYFDAARVALRHVSWDNLYQKSLVRINSIVYKTVYPQIDAPKASLNAFFRTFMGNSKTDFLDAGGVFRWHTAIPHPWFNGVLASRPPSNNEPAVIQEQVDYFQSQGVDIFSWWLEPGLSVEEWTSQLQPFGLKINQDVPGMVCDLKELPSALSTPAGFTIQVVNDLEKLKIWTEVFCSGFGVPRSFITSYYELFAGVSSLKDLRNYLGILDGTPVAASSLFVSDGIAGIYNVAVLVQARGMGLGAAITLAPLLEARHQGYAIGALQSSEMGFNVYRRLGFRKVCDVTHFYYKFGEKVQE